MRTFQDFDDLAACTGQQVAVSAWVSLPQEKIDQFAQATGDLQWIHTDPQRAAQGQFGSTIAHGFLTLSLLPQLFATAFEVQGVRMGVNYGLNKVRFITPVPSNSQVRGHFKLLHLERLPPSGAQLTWEVTVELQGADKPACVAEAIVQLFV
jgi:acyl dehydratase